ncbi:MAG: SH3 domain-containing protein [Treponema sp.]|jgi:hypothetical protein|nr:SH3 domain-containing protein [Treponema sp.]
MRVKHGLFYVLFFLLINNIYAQNGEGVWVHEPGFYYILEDRVNIRSQPNSQGSIIGRLGLNDRIEVLSREGGQWENIQQVDHIFSHWYKIKFNNIVGYIFGGFIARETLVFDIDGNGQNDYFHYRVSDTNHVFWVINPRKDIFIYINNIRIPTDNIQGTWMWCSFKRENNNVILELSSGSSGPGYFSTAIYRIDANGNMMFIRRADEDTSDDY